MTGFGRAQVKQGRYHMRVVLSSVNGRYMDVKLSLPDQMAGLEMQIREKVAQVVKRGSVRVRVDIIPDAPDNPQDTQSLRELLNRVAGVIPEGATPVVDLVAATKLQEIMAQELTPQEAEALLSALDSALETLDTTRKQEGQRTEEFFTRTLSRLAELVGLAEKEKKKEQQLRKEKIHSNLAEIANADDELRNRLLFEVSAMMLKLDVEEELNRLNTHLSAFEKALKKGGVVGKRLEFLCQEMHREANTLSSKSFDPELIKIAIDMKELIERIKEQVRNIE